MQYIYHVSYACPLGECPLCIFGQAQNRPGCAKDIISNGRSMHFKETLITQ